MSEDFSFDEVPDDAPAPPVSGSLLAPVEAEAVALSEGTPTDIILQVHDRCKFYLAEIKRIQKLCEAAMIERIKASGPITVKPGVRWIVANPKTTKCTDLPGAVEALLDASGGDFAKFVDVLASNAIKYGAASKVLTPEAFDKFFKVTYPDKLEEKGGEKAAGRLTKIDDMFLPKKS